MSEWTLGRAEKQNPYGKLTAYSNYITVGFTYIRLSVTIYIKCKG